MGKTWRTGLLCLTSNVPLPQLQAVYPQNPFITRLQHVKILPPKNHPKNIINGPHCGHSKNPNSPGKEPPCPGTFTWQFRSPYSRNQRPPDNNKFSNSKSIRSHRPCSISKGDRDSCKTKGETPLLTKGAATNSHPTDEC